MIEEVKTQLAAFAMVGSALLLSACEAAGTTVAVAQPPDEAPPGAAPSQAPGDEYDMPAIDYDRMFEQAQGAEGSCLSEVGRKEAERLARACNSVSPATHPPCHMANSCELIVSEIRRSCEMLEGVWPKDCDPAL